MKATSEWIFRWYSPLVIFAGCLVVGIALIALGAPDKVLNVLGVFMQVLFISVVVQDRKKYEMSQGFWVLRILLFGPLAMMSYNYKRSRSTA